MVRRASARKLAGGGVTSSRIAPYAMGYDSDPPQSMFSVNAGPSMLNAQSSENSNANSDVSTVLSPNKIQSQTVYSDSFHHNPALRRALKLLKEVQGAQTKYDGIDVYHFTQSPSLLVLEPNMLIRYDNILFEDAEENLMEILDVMSQISERILIVFASNPEDPFDMPDLLRRCLTSFYATQPLKSLQNITVINHTSFEKGMVSETRPSRYTHLRKILNVLSFNNLSLRNIAMRDILLARATIGGESFLFKFLDQIPSMPNNPSLQVLDQWWFMYFNRVPPCADGRLIQHLGTCWWNTAANILILSQPIAALLRIIWRKEEKQYRKVIKSIPINVCPSPKLPHKDFLLVLIHHLVIKRRRMKGWQKVLLGEAGGRSKNSAAGTTVFQKLLSEFSSDARTYGNKGNPLTMGLKPFLQELFVLGSHYNTIKIDAKEIRLCRRHIIWNTPERKSSNQPRDDSWEQFPYPMFVILEPECKYYSRFKRCPLEIFVNGATYALEAAALTNHNGTHVIAGMTCHSTQTRYLYDSNNAIGKDDWSTLRMGQTLEGMSGYMAELKLKNIQAPTCGGFNFIIYVLQTDQWRLTI